MPTLNLMANHRRNRTRPNLNGSSKQQHIVEKKTNNNNSDGNKSLKTSWRHFLKPQSQKRMSTTTVGEQPCTFGGKPNVQIVVGNQTFHHYDFLLRYSCGYFERVLGAATTTQEAVVRFPDLDPRDWPRVVSFLEPYSVQTSPFKPKITEDNVDLLLPWFHKLELHSLLQECDMVYSQTVQDNIINNNINNTVYHQQTHRNHGTTSRDRGYCCSMDSTSSLSSTSSTLCATTVGDNDDDIGVNNAMVRGMQMVRCIQILELAELYGLSRTRTNALAALKDYLQDNPHVLVGWPELYRTIWDFLHHDELWHICVGRYLPSKIQQELRNIQNDDNDQEDAIRLKRLEILGNPLLEDLLFAKVVHLCDA